MHFRKISGGHELADDEIMVDIQSDNTARIRAAYVEPDPVYHSMPDALQLARVWLHRESHLYTEIVIHIHEGAEWKESWGELLTA